MSITLHKVMGYGLTGLELDERGRIIDTRINTSSILLDGDREGEATLREYVRSTLENDESLDRVLKGWRYGHLNPDSTEPADSVQHLFETSLSDTVILRPVGDKDWSRRANLIDMYEEEAKGEGVRDYITALPGGIYPYNNRFMDLTTFERIDWSFIGDWVRAVNGGAYSVRLEIAAFEASGKLGWGDIGHEALRKRIGVMPPEEIIQLASFGQLFTQPEHVFELRPMIATFWR